MFRYIQRFAMRRGMYGGDSRMLALGLGLLAARRILGGNDKAHFSATLAPGENLMLTQRPPPTRRSRRTGKRAQRQYHSRLTGGAGRGSGR